MIAAHVQSHFQKDKDILSFELKRDFRLLKSQHRSTLAKLRETHPTHTAHSLEITKMILKEVLGAETIDESSNLLLCPDSSAECLLASHDAHDPIGNPTAPLKVGSQGIRMHDNPAMRRSTPDRGLLSQRPSSSLSDQRTRNSDQLSQSEHGTSSSTKNSVFFALASQSRTSHDELEAQSQRRVMSMGGFYGLEYGTSNSTRRQRNTTLQHEDSKQQSGWGPSRSPFRSELGTTRNAEWALNSPSSEGLSTSTSSFRIKAALSLMQEGALPSAKVIRIAALNAASTTNGTPVPTMQVNTTQSCPNGLNNVAMEAVAKNRTTNNIRIRRILGRSQSLGNRRRPVSCRTPLETIDESKESATFSKHLKSGR
jgi:hypothetical protein